jgi:hypothetical protein
MPIFLHRRLSQLTCKYDREVADPGLAGAVNLKKKRPGEALAAPPGAIKSIIAPGLEFAQSSAIGQGHLLPSQFFRMSLNHDFHFVLGDRKVVDPGSAGAVNEIQTGRHCTPGCVFMELFLSAPLVNGRACR